MLEISNRTYVDPVVFTVAFTSLGEKEKALDYLELAYEKKADNLTLIAVDPFFDPLREEPRFKTILKKMNFPQLIRN